MINEENNIWDFLSLEWFQISFLQNFQWENPLFLYLIPFVPLLFVVRWIIYLRLQKKLDIALFSDSPKFDVFSLLRFIPTILQNILIMLLLLCLARPQKVNEQVERWIENIDIMLILDTSSSMEGMDLKPNRMESLKKLAEKFIDGREQDRIGLVVFAGDAFSYAPLTTDYTLLKSLLKTVKIKMLPTDGTAIGSALAVAVNRMQESKSKSKVAILLSDGENTAGQIDPNTAADLAYGYGIKVYTIGIGKNGKVPYPATNVFGMKTTMMVENSFNEKTLREIADKTEAKFFRATNNKALEEIFEIINEFEKSEVKETRYKNTKDYYFIYLKWALFIFCMLIILKFTFINNFLQD